MSTRNAKRLKTLSSPISALPFPHQNVYLLAHLLNLYKSPQPPTHNTKQLEEATKNKGRTHSTSLNNKKTTTPPTFISHPSGSAGWKCFESPKLPCRARRDTPQRPAWAHLPSSFWWVSLFFLFQFFQGSLGCVLFFFLLFSLWVIFVGRSLVVDCFLMYLCSWRFSCGWLVWGHCWCFCCSKLPLLIVVLQVLWLKSNFRVLL